MRVRTDLILAGTKRRFPEAAFNSYDIGPLEIQYRWDTQVGKAGFCVHPTFERKKAMRLHSVTRFCSVTLVSVLFGALPVSFPTPAGKWPTAAP